MRAALWFTALFGLAVAGAWLASHNEGTVSLFLYPWRLDLSLNFAALLLGLLLALLLLAQKALATLFSLPREARRWRLQQKERAAHEQLLQAYGQFMAGRYLRARRTAESVLDKEQAFAQTAEQPLPHAAALRTVAHVLAAESAHALQDQAARVQHVQAAQQEIAQAPGQERQILQEGVALRAARWALDDRDASASLAQLAQLPPAVARRTAALRMQLKAARLAGQTDRALETALLLAKHRAFSPGAAQSLVRSLVLERIERTQESRALERLWAQLPPAQRLLPEVAAAAMQRGLALGLDAAQCRQWLLPIWTALGSQTPAWPAAPTQVLALALENSWRDAGSADARAWLARIEVAQRAHPSDARLQYLAGMACWRHQLWGKAQGLLAQAVKGLDAQGSGQGLGPGSNPLARRAWRALAELAEQREDSAAALQAWRQAAQRD